MISSAQAGRAVGPWGPLPATAPLRGGGERGRGGKRPSDAGPVARVGGLTRMPHGRDAPEAEHGHGDAHQERHPGAQPSCRRRPGHGRDEETGEEDQRYVDEDDAPVPGVPLETPSMLNSARGSA